MINENKGDLETLIHYVTHVFLRNRISLAIFLQLGGYSAVRHLHQFQPSRFFSMLIIKFIEISIQFVTVQLVVIDGLICKQKNPHLHNYISCYFVLCLPNLNRIFGNLLYTVYQKESNRINRQHLNRNRHSTHYE